MFKKFIILITGITVIVSVSYLLSKEIFYLTSTTPKFFGLDKQIHLNFNWPLFIGINLTGLLLLTWFTFRKEISGLFSLTISNNQKKWIRAISIFLLLAGLITYVVGITMPLFKTTRFFFDSDEITLLNSVELMFEMREFFIGWIIALFSIGAPQTL